MMLLLRLLLNRKRCCRCLSWLAISSFVVSVVLFTWCCLYGGWVLIGPQGTFTKTNVVACLLFVAWDGLCYCMLCWLWLLLVCLFIVRSVLCNCCVH